MATRPIAKAWRTRTMADDPFIGHSNVSGTLAFAFAVPNGRTTQLFFNLRTTPRRTTRSRSCPSAASSPASTCWTRSTAEYGDTSGGGIRAGHQDGMFDQGNAFFTKFPGLDRIRRATVVNR